MRFLAILARNTLAGVLFFVSMWTLSVVPQGEPAERPLPVGSPALALTQCEIVPEGVFPTGVILQKVGGDTRVIRNGRAVDRALDVALEGADWPGMRVLHFCK